jgi:hypothetical protein
MRGWALVNIFLSYRSLFAAPFSQASCIFVALLSLGGKLFSHTFFYLANVTRFYWVNLLLLLLYSSTIKSDSLAFYIILLPFLRGP